MSEARPDGMTREEIARALGISRVEQLERRALAKARDWATARGLHAEHLLDLSRRAR